MTEEISSKLWEYQIPSAKTLLQSIVKWNGAVDGSDTGTGKTFVMCAVARQLNRPLFVLCPRLVMSSWMDAARYFGVEILVYTYEKTIRGIPNVVRREEKDFSWILRRHFLLVFDECQRLWQTTTWTCALGLSAWRQGYTVVGLSGTLADNPEQMKFVGLVCRLFARERDFASFLSCYNCRQKKDSRWEFIGSDNVMKELHHRIFPEHGTRIRIAALGSRFPESLVTAHKYDAEEARERLQKLYQKMEEELLQVEKTKATDQSKKFSFFRIYTRARQEAELLKVPIFLELTQELLAQSFSVVIFLNYRNSLKALSRLLETDCIIQGGMPLPTLQQNIARFQSVTNPRAALHSPSPSGRDTRQGLGRVHRGVGNAKPPTSKNPSRVLLCNLKAAREGISLHSLAGHKSLQRFCFVAGTLEERIYDKVQERLRRMQLLHDGDLAFPQEHERLHREMHFPTRVPPVITSR